MTSMSSPFPQSRTPPAAVVTTALLVAIPPMMWAANRSAPLLLGLAGLASLMAAWQAGEARAVLGSARRALLSPIGLSLLVFLIWALLSLSWSHRPGAGLRMHGELVVSLAAGCIVAWSWPRLAPRWALRALACSLALTGALVLLEVRLGPGARDALGLRSQAYIFNRPILTGLLLLAPLLNGLWGGPDVSFRDRLLAVLGAGGIVAAMMAGESGAAKLGLILMVLTWLAARLLPRLTLAAVMAGFVALMALAPVLGPLADRALPPAVYERLARAHARERVDIWLSFGEAVQARPLIGSGFNSAAALLGHPVAGFVTPEHRPMLDVGHPHNAYLQAWVETGFVGVALLTAAGFLALWRLRHLPARELAPRLGVVVAALGVATVGHGAWQGWWIAALGAVVAWFLAGTRRASD